MNTSQPQPPSTPKLSDSQKTVLNWLRHCGPGTAAQITAVTALAYPTVTLALRRLHTAGLATSSGRAWTATPSSPHTPEDPTPLDEFPQRQPGLAPDGPEQPDVDPPAPNGRRPYRRTGTPRLAKGELRGLVLDYLREHPDLEFGPTAIAKALGRADGAVINACNKLAANGQALRTQDAPARFKATPS
ncbi:MarR family transcriptional regulator [Catellatospora paridis]|uniref:MarR family transcriptional regulator n=1 Tax=Catellatospora paridis TaxID=1617086 RepID=UPI0012D46E81|nr:helix-turn-helix domain-containing protein [Catellatospora paridis]